MKKLDMISNIVLWAAVVSLIFVTVRQHNFIHKILTETNEGSTKSEKMFEKHDDFVTIARKDKEIAFRNAQWLYDELNQKKAKPEYNSGISVYLMSQLKHLCQDTNISLKFGYEDALLFPNKSKAQQRAYLQYIEKTVERCHNDTSYLLPE